MLFSIRNIDILIGRKYLFTPFLVGFVIISLAEKFNIPLFQNYLFVAYNDWGIHCWFLIIFDGFFILF